ncbi:PEP-CTERM sorting domain-containing protein [Silvimonas iriomotensis]
MTSPVPEPGTWLTMLTGLIIGGVLTFAIRRPSARGRRNSLLLA